MSSTTRTIAGIAVAGLLVAAGVASGFLWGFQAHREQVFPYDLIKGLATGRWTPPPPETPGRWRLRDGRRPWILDDPDAFTLQALEELGYAQGSTVASDEAGVTVRTGDAAPGLNLVTSGHAATAMLMDLDGQEVHRWTADWARLFPEQVGTVDPPRPYLRRARLLPDGGLVSLFVDRGAFRLDRDSQVVWTWSGGAHHDLAVDEDRLWLLARRPELRTDHDPKRPMFDDALVRLDLATGEERQRFTLWQAVADSAFAPLLQRVRPREDGDPLHSNTVRVLDGRFSQKNPAFAAGNLLISVRHTDWVVIVDPRVQQVVWAMTGPWHQPHEPTLVGPGHLLIFDNLGAWPRSRVLEIEPTSQRLMWAYDGGDSPLISETCGTAQRLANGNTLAVASDTGRAVEVDRQGRVVWAYANPARAGDDGELVATLFQVERLSGDALGIFAPPPDPAADVPPPDPPAER